MSDDLDKKIQQIAEMLGQDKVPDNLKSLVSLFASSLNNKESSTVKTSEEEPATEVKIEQTASSEDNTEMVRKVKKLMSGLNTEVDPRINLLHAIKPFMNGKRQKKIGSAIQLLQMTSLARLMNNNDK